MLVAIYGKSLFWQEINIGEVDAFVTHPDGKTFFRVNNHWFPADMCELVE